MNNDIPSLVESVLRLDKEATKGPWRGKVFTCSIYSNCPDVVDEKGDCIALMDSRGALAGPDEIKSNSALITTYRSAAPILAKAYTEKDAEVTRLQKELETERRKVEDFREDFQAIDEALNWNQPFVAHNVARKALAALTPSEKGEIK